MRIKQSLATEFFEMAVHYNEQGPQGRDTIALIRKFAEEYDHFDDLTDRMNYRTAWEGFVEEHKDQILVLFPTPMLALILHALAAYWEQGERLLQSVSVTDKLMVRDLVFEMTEVKLAQSPNGNDPVPA